VKIFKGKKDFTEIKLCSIFSEALLSAKDLPKITARAVIQNQEKLVPCLEGVVQPNYEWVASIRKYISFSNSVLY
jgi:hypothetical protein